MKQFACIVFFAALPVWGEVHSLTLHQALERAAASNPDLLLARLDLEKSRAAIVIAKDPFFPKVTGGSGAAWTTGFPANINGSPPSIFQVRTDMSLFNRPQSYGVAQAKETARAAGIDVERQKEEAAYRTAALYLDARRLMQTLEIARKQGASLEAVRDNATARLAEGRELPVSVKRAELALARAAQRVEILEENLETTERTLAVVLGFAADDRVRATADDIPLLASTPDSEEAAAQQAMAHSKEMQALTSRMQAKNLEIKSYQAARLPQVGLVAQYNLLAKYNYSDFYANYSNFTPHSAQLGAFLMIPLLVGPASKAYVAQNEVDVARLRAQVEQVRNRIAFDTRKSFLEMQRMQTARTIAKLDLEVTREQLSVALARYGEGRVALAEVEQLRAEENEKWLAYYDAEHQFDRVKLDLLHQTGALTASLE